MSSNTRRSFRNGDVRKDRFQRRTLSRPSSGDPSRLSTVRTARAEGFHMSGRWLLLPVVLVISTTVSGAPRQQPVFVPKDGFVPNAATAIRIAEAIWIPIYDEEQIQSERPFEANLSNGVWTVTGSLP